MLSGIIRLIQKEENKNSILFNTLSTFKLYGTMVYVKGGIKEILDFSSTLNFLSSGEN